MADKINQKRAGFAVGAFAAFMHLVWIIIVAAGFGQWWINFKTGIHFLSVPATVTAFNPMTAALLLVIAFAVGFAIGWLFAWFWNWAGKWK